MALQEASSGVYKFKDISEVLLEKLVTFFYSGNYDEDLDASPTKMSALQLHARMFALGEQYCLPNLQPLCVKKYEARLDSECGALEFIESIPDVYNSTAGPVRDLKGVVARYARYRIAEIVQDGEEEAKLAYDDARQKAPEFAMDLLDQYTGTPQCKTCFSGAKLETTKTGRNVCKWCLTLV